jgi:hypothetical protein
MKKLGNFAKLEEKFMKKPFVFFGFVFLIMLFAANANAFVLTFDGLQQDEEILNYYNGGFGSDGSGPGPNYGVTFSGTALALNSGNYADNPSPPGILYWLTANPYMDVAAGFTTGFSFYYSAPYYTGGISVYSGLDGAGTLLASFSLPLTTPGPSGENYNDWVPIGVSFSGIAESVQFTGTADYIGFDNVTFGSATPTVPEPSTLLLLGSGLLGLVGLRWRRN